MYDFLTGREFVARQRQAAPAARPGAPPPQRALAMVEMADAPDRAIATYSKGMSQRIKMAVGARARPAGAAARRAVQRHGPAAAAAPDGPAAPDGRRGPDGPVQLAHPGGGRAARRHIEVIVAGPARRLRRLPRDPAADDRPAAPCSRSAPATTARSRPRSSPTPSTRGRRADRGGGLRACEAVDFGAFTAAAAAARPRRHGIRLLRGLARRRVAGKRLLLPGGGLR